MLSSVHSGSRGVSDTPTNANPVGPADFHAGVGLRGPLRGREALVDVVHATHWNVHGRNDSAGSGAVHPRDYPFCRGSSGDRVSVEGAEPTSAVGASGGGSTRSSWTACCRSSTCSCSRGVNDAARLDADLRGQQPEAGKNGERVYSWLTCGLDDPLRPAQCASVGCRSPAPIAVVVESVRHWNHA